MVGYRSTRLSFVLPVVASIGVAMLLGQGCPGLTGGAGQIESLTPSVSDYTAASSTPSDSTAPYCEFTYPLTDVSYEVGDIVPISWRYENLKPTTTIQILLDPDETFGNGNELVVLPLVLVSSGTTSFNLDTKAQSLPAATYRVVARVNDGTNPEMIVAATGRILLFGAGLLPGNHSPSITLCDPTLNLGVSQGDQVTIAYCASDPDNGPNGIIPDIVILLDMDDNPNNDLVLSSTGGEANLAAACAGPFPEQINGAIVLSCTKKTTDCTALPNAATLTQTIDVSQIPPRIDGQPYRIRGTIWDHINPPVHSYAPGNVSVTGLASGVVDLGQVGRTVSGTKFMGFDAGGLAGSGGLDVGDMDGDGASEFVILSRLGRPAEVGNVGAAHLVYGMKGQKFGNEINLNSVGTLYRGCEFTMPYSAKTDGLVSVCRVTDARDGHPDILFGMPYIERFWDSIDDDPRNSDDCCYLDLLPNPKSYSGWDTLCGCDSMRDADWREGTYTVDNIEYICSNDNDFNNDTPINGGYGVLVTDTNLTSGVIDLNRVGQYLRGCTGPVPEGARWRGPWYDEPDNTQTNLPFRIIPDNRFGQNVASQPPMTDNSLNISPRYGEDLLFSAPGAFRARGAIVLTPGQNFPHFEEGATESGCYCASFPVYEDPGVCGRVRVYPGFTMIEGAAIGDGLGYAGPAGDFNMDGSRDILCGAPNATRNGILNGGIVYVLFGRPDFPNPFDLGRVNPPRLEIRGTNPGDQFGAMQTIIGDINHDGIPDIGFASQYADGPAGPDAGFVGIVFGGRRLTGENIFTVNNVGTAILPGVKFYGAQANGRAGAVIANAGDFNGDGTDDLLVCAPNETRVVDGQTRRGVAYVIFGGPHLVNGSFNLSQVGSSALPGMVIVTPYIAGSADDAPIDWVSGAGDVNGDGFADILVGVSTADYVNPLSPSQRRVDAGEAYLIYGSNTGSNAMH